MKTRKSWLLSILLLLAPALARADAAPDLKQRIVGKWHAAEDKDKSVIVEITADGKITATLIAGTTPGSVQSSYKWIDDKHIETSSQIGVDGQPATATEKLEVGFDGDDLTMTDSKGKVDRFIRIK